MTNCTTLQIGMVSLPFLEPQVSCHPLLLLDAIAKERFHEARCISINGHAEFALNFIDSQSAFETYRRLTREPYLGDLCLIPLLAGTSQSVLSERESLLTEANIKLDFADALLVAFNKYVAQCAKKLLHCDVVGITATHFQLVPSLILARALRNLRPKAPKLVLGGYLSSVDVAQALLDTHPSLAVVVFGEAEDVWPKAIEYCLADKPPMVMRGGASELNKFKPQPDSVIEEFRGTWVGKHLQVTLEVSRGCYWDKCDFCNFNASYKSHFSRNDFASVVNEMDRLARNYDQTRFVYLDTAIPPSFVRYLQEQDIRRDFSVFAEVRPDFSCRALEDFSRLGSLTLQIGVESLVDSHVYGMAKNASVVDNVRGLLACKKLGISVVWGVFVDHPKENTDQLKELLWRLQNWQHLPAPKYVTHCQLRPGSPLWQERASFGHEIVPRTQSFSHVLPQFDQALEFFPHIEIRNDKPPEHARLISQIEETVHQWRHAPKKPCVKIIEEPLFRDVVRIMEDRILSASQVRSGLHRIGQSVDQEKLTAALAKLEAENYICSSIRTRRKVPEKVYTPLHLLEDLLGHANISEDTDYHALS